MSSHKHKPSLIRLYTKQSFMNTSGKISLRQNSFHHLKKHNSQSCSNFIEQNPPPTASSNQSNSLKNSQIEFRSSFQESCLNNREAVSERTQTNSCNKFSLKNPKEYLKESGFNGKNDVSNLGIGFSGVILNLKYSDIIFKKKSTNMFQFAKDLCTNSKGMPMQQYVNNKPQGIISLFDFGKKRTIHYGCKCQAKCLTVDRWLQNEGIITVRQKQYDSKAYARYLNQIQKDLKRTQPHQITFQSELYLFRLKQTLSAYAKLDPQVGYTQGMNFIASIFVYHAPDLNSCIKLMELFFIKKDFRSVYINDFRHCKKHSEAISHLLEKKCYEMHNFFANKHQIYLQIFIQGWMFTLLGNIIPIDYMHQVIDMFMKESFKGVYKLICTLLLYMYEKKQLKHLDDATDVMELLSIQSLTKCGIDWQEVLLSCHHFPINQKQVAKGGQLIVLK